MTALGSHGERAPVLTAADRKLLRLALNLARQWEASLMDSCSPDPLYKATTHQKAMMRQCQRNIAAFEKLRAKIDGVR